MQRILLLVLLLTLLLPTALGLLVATEAGLRTAVALINRLSSGLLTIDTASGTLLQTLRLGNIRSTDGIDTVTIRELTLTWQPRELLHRRILIPSIHGVDVRVILGESSDEEFEPPPFTLPLELLIGSVTADRLTIADQQQELWVIRRAALRELSFSGTTLRLADLALSSDQSELHGQGALHTTRGYPLEWTVEARLQPEGYAPIVGTASLTGPVNALLVAAECSQPFPVRLTGRLDHLLGATTWQARAEGAEVRLERIHPQWPEQRFSQVVIDGAGSLDRYTLGLQSLTGLPQQKEPAELRAEISGDGNGLQVASLRLNRADSSLAAAGSLTWSPELTWQAELSGTHLDPALFFPDWPGDFGCSLTTSGQYRGGKLMAAFLLPELQGSLRGFPLSGQGEAQLKDKQLHIPHLLLNSGNSTLRASGSVADRIDLQLRLESNNLAELWPQAKGKLKAQAQLSGSADKPRLESSIVASGLGSGAAGMGMLKAEAKGLLTRDGAVEATIRADQLVLDSWRIDQALLKLQGSLAAHTLSLEGRGPDFSLACSLQGMLKDRLWQGTLVRSHFSSTTLGRWQQAQQAALTVGAERMEIKPLCLSSPNSGRLCLEGSWTGLTGSWQAHAEVSALALPMLAKAVEQPWPIQGTLDCAVDLSGSRSSLTSGKGWCDSSGMQALFTLPEGTPHRVSWKKNSLHAAFAANRLQLALESELKEAGTVQLEVQLDNLALPGADLLRAPMQGSLRTRLTDLSPVALLTDQMVHLGGSLIGQFALSGTPGAPLINGQMELANGKADIPPLGITLAPLQVALKGDNKRLQLIATAQSGEGQLRAETLYLLDQSDAAAHTLKLIGTRFKAAHLPDLELDVSPDLELRLGRKRVDVHGTLAIPRARLTSIDRYKAITPSEDMVVVDEEGARDSALTFLPLFYAVTLLAGDDVRLDTFGLRGAVTGKLEVRGQPGRPPTGNGTLNIKEGTFTLYGKRLNIDLGRLLFSGGPLTDPGVEIRSEHKSGKVTTGVRVDGFLRRPEITFYSTPAMEQSAIIAHLLQSTAIGGETREETGFIGSTASRVGLGGVNPLLKGVKKLTMIDEIRMETGEKYEDLSLVFGSWLTPDFYVSYGKDLLKESGSFNTRYTLGKGFFFSTETGSTQSGGDLFYEFEY